MRPRRAGSGFYTAPPVLAPADRFVRRFTVVLDSGHHVVVERLVGGGIRAAVDGFERVVDPAGTLTDAYLFVIQKINREVTR